MVLSRSLSLTSETSLWLRSILALEPGRSDRPFPQVCLLPMPIFILPMALMGEVPIGETPREGTRFGLVACLLQKAPEERTRYEEEDQEVEKKKE